MLTPQEVAGRTFAKAKMGGYNTAMVDALLDQLTIDYTTLYKENGALKAKMKVLADKIEEYRATEDSMRATLLMAQKMASGIVEEAEQRREELLASAETEARRKIGSLRQELEDEQRRLAEAKAQTAIFLEQTRALCLHQMELLENCPNWDMRQEEPLPVQMEEPAEWAESSAEETVEEVQAQALFQEAPETEETTVFPILRLQPDSLQQLGEEQREKLQKVEQWLTEGNEELPVEEATPSEEEELPPVASVSREELFQSSRLRLDDLQFGRNYTGFSGK